MIDIEKVREALKRIELTPFIYSDVIIVSETSLFTEEFVDIDEALTELERLQKKEVRFKKMLNDTIESNEVKLKKGYWDRIVYENQILKNVLNMLDWSDEK